MPPLARLTPARSMASPATRPKMVFDGIAGLSSRSVPPLPTKRRGAVPAELPLVSSRVPPAMIAPSARPPAITRSVPPLLARAPIAVPPEFTISRLPGPVTTSPLSVTPDETTKVAPPLTIFPDMCRTF